MALAEGLHNLVQHLPNMVPSGGALDQVNVPEQINPLLILAFALIALSFAVRASKPFSRS